MGTLFYDLPVTDGKSGSWTLDTFTISQEKAHMLSLRADVTGNQNEYIPPGKYRRLSNNGEVVMSNTPMEINTCMEFIERATGRVLINGLGLGMVLHVILQKKEVTHVTVIEKEQDVINLVAPALIDDKRVDIICADAMTYQPPAGVTYDVCWHDIWTYFSAENLQEMENLERKYLFLCKWQASWGMQECLNAFINSRNQSDA
ncbi:TPA: hypothetical protein ACWXE1_004793 [Klebsiella pneumoniae]|nr:hypothetical protein [Klebsiella pneumoniae]